MSYPHATIRCRSWVRLFTAIVVLSCLISPATAQSRYCVYVTNNANKSVSIIDTLIGQALHAIPVGDTPVGIALTPDNRFAYVVNSGGGMAGSVSVISTESNTSVATIPIPGSLRLGAVAITPDGAFAYVADSVGSSARLYVIATATNRVVTSIDASSVSSIAMAPTGTTAYAAHNFYPGSLLTIDLASKAVLHSVVTGGYSEGIAVSPGGDRVFITNGDDPGRVTVVNTSTDTVMAEIPVARVPRKVAITPNGATAYVTHGNLGAATLSVLDAVSLTLSKEIRVGSSPMGVAVTPDGGFAYIANSEWDSVSVVDTSTNEVAATIGVGRSPMEVAIAPAPGGCAVPFATPNITPIPTATPVPTQSREEQLHCAQPLRRTLSAGHTDAYEIVVTAPGAVRLSVSNTVLSSVQLELRKSNGEVVATIAGRLLDATLLPGAYKLIVSADADEPTTPYTLTWVSGAPSVFVSIPRANEVSVIDTVKDVISNHIRLPFPPGPIAMSPDGKRAYVGSITSPTLSIIDTASGTVTDSIFLLTPTSALAITPDEMRAYVANQQTLSVVDLSGKLVAAKVGVDLGASDVDISPSGDRVYVKNHTSNTVSVVDTATNSKVATIRLPEACPIGPSTLAIAPGGNRIYAENCGAETLSIIDAATNAIVGNVRLHTTLEDVAVTPDGTLAYVRQGTAPLLSIVDLDRLIIVGDVPYGFVANGLVTMAPDGAFAYVTVSYPGTTAVVDTATDSVVAEVALPTTDPARIVVSPSSCTTTNDACVNAARVRAFPAAVEAVTGAATPDATDPVPICAADSRNHSVWYRLAAPGTGTVTVQTSGSTYETAVAAYTGSCDALAAVVDGCARDPRAEKGLSLSVTKGTTYYVMIATSESGGGDLAVQFAFEPRPPISFQKTQVLETFPAAQRFELVDVNRDGKPDLVLPGEILLNDGTGRFDDSNPVLLAGSVNASGFAVADFNRDGAQDIAVVSTDLFAGTSTLDVYLGDGSGKLSATQTYALQKEIFDLAVADFDSDGVPDIIALTQDRVYLLHGIGNGEFAALQEPGMDAGGTASSAITTGFLNDDAIPDLVVTDRTFGNVGILLGNGDGTFRTARQYQVGKFPAEPAIADLNGDGFPDIAVMNTGEAQGSNVSLLFGTRDYPQPEVRISAGFVSSYSSLLAADLDGDHKPDLAATSTQGSAVAVLRYDPTDPFRQYNFAVDGTVRGLVPGDGQTAIRAADLNGDGSIDLVVANRTGVTVFLNITGQPVQCSGDCDLSGQVTLDEILTMVNIALGNADVDNCLVGDLNYDGQVTVDEILNAVNNALNGCHPV